MTTFRIHSPRAIAWLRQFHGMVFMAAQLAVVQGGCVPGKVLEELRNVLHRLEGHGWKTKGRDEILNESTITPSRPWPKGALTRGNKGIS